MGSVWKSKCGMMELRLGDYREVLADVEADHCITDPPYSERSCGVGTASRGGYLTVIELFAGAGGAGLGLAAAGLKSVAHVEWDADACETLRAAGCEAVHECDVREYAVPDGGADVVWSSFPCQDFSLAGKREGARGARNGWPWTVRVIDEAQPTWLLAENVTGLVMHRAGCTAGQLSLMGDDPEPEDCPRCYFDRVILADLRARFAHVGWWVLDAADYGVPQHRRRVIIWAGPAPLRRPRPTHGPGRMPHVTTAHALGLDGWLDMGRHFTGHPTKDVRGTDRPSMTILATDRSPSFTPRIIGGGHNPNHAGDAVRNYTDLTNRPSTTIAARQAGNAGPFVVSEGGRRRLTVAECAALQGFPPSYPFQGTATSRHRQVGNAVPPALAEAVARTLP